jgi:YesN/AraC family two-component response regulator
MAHGTRYSSVKSKLILGLVAIRDARMAKQNSRWKKDRKPFKKLTSSQKRSGVNEASGNPTIRKVTDPKDINNNAFSYYSCLRRLKQYVENHQSENIPLQTAARIASMERKYFSAFFHKKTGLTYLRWLNSIRIAKAVALIKITDDSLTQIASTVGFRDLRTFERSFKKLTKVTPSKFRKSVRPS